MKSFLPYSAFLWVCLCLSTVMSPALAQEHKAPESTSSSSQKNTESPRPTLTVTAVHPSFQTVKKNLQANGNIEAREIASITAQTAGLSLSRLRVAVGDYVKKGQLIAEYDASSVYNDIAQAKASLMQAQVALRQASANAKRARRLGKSSAISKIERDNFLYQEQMAKAKVAAAKAVLSNQQLRASYAKVKTKVSGMILAKQAVLGEVGNPGTPLFSVLVNNELEWQAKVPSELLNLVRPNMPVAVTLTQASTSADGEQSTIVKGKVRRIDPTVDPQTRQGLVYVTMDYDARLRRGLFLRGEFLLGEVNVLIVPISCLVRKDGYNYVFVVGKDNHVIRKKVAIGQLQGKNATVLSGLNADERVVSSGVGFLSSGDLVNVVDK